MEAQIAEASKLLIAKRRALAAAMTSVKVHRTCLKEACETAIRLIVSIPLMQADIAVHSLSLQRLKASITNTYQQEMHRRMLDGTYDRVTAATQIANRQTIIKVQVDAFRQAVASAATFSDRSPDARPLASQMRERFDNIRRELDSNKGLPPGVSPNLGLTEDAAEAFRR